ncbi:RNA polymerase sigma factor [Sphingomonas sp. UNC305MFCol5.2]|uniref:RNA polymerase sigma factor n=1 Tax=Sphingomonas sp. UNC305MFCol5.2 TaxID=1449076 RepID=UPI001E29E6EE|nr:RNA polymerase sigma factor [Sphingomonas sp. UNC305MFCol5.2]
MSGRPVARAGEEAGEPLAAGETGDAAEDVASLYRAEGPRLLRFFRRRTANPEEARDLVQESFSRMLGAGAGAGLMRPEAYLRRIGQNLLRDRAKFAVRRSAALHMSADDAVLAGLDQFRLLETRDLLDRLELAMLELPQETREVFMAHRVEGLTYAEIAERTGLTLKQVEKRIARAMLDLSDLLGSR